ncbi:MAG: phage/plasmid primase, P4 family [Nocardioidaceae bacterium]
MTTTTFAEIVLGDREGFVAVAYGRNPHWTGGKYGHQSWHEIRFRWPADRDRMLAEVSREMSNADVYVCPAVRFTDDRRKGSALPPMVCWADLDADPGDTSLWDALNPFVVASGTPGHRHPYVPLSRPVDLGTHARLNQALRDRLGGDHKWSDEVLLRLPGSRNHKADPPGLVTIEAAAPTVWDPDDLAMLLGVGNGESAHGRGHFTEIVEPGPVDLDSLPQWLWDRLSEPAPEDHSTAFHGLVGACKDAGLTQGQTVTVMASWQHLPDRYGHRVPTEVARCWGKVTNASTITGRNSGRYFHKKEGLLVASLAEDVIAVGPIAEGIDDIMWSYANGVWVPDKHVVRKRAAQLLGQQYRRAHGLNVEDVVRAQSPTIACEPITEVINFRNGLYLWKADLLREHTPDVLSTVQLGVDYDPDAGCPEFDKFLAGVIPKDMIGRAWELIGYLMYSGNPLHKAVMLTGTGRNGKGTFLRVLVALLGQRNVTSVSLQDLVGTRFSTASLFGKIANIAGDIDGTYLENTATFKAVTGQDLISAEHKGRDRFDFTPWAVPMFSANKIPASADVTVGYLSRWLVVNFPHDFTGREDRHLDERLHTKDELAGVAAKAMPAMRRLMERGDFDLPKSGMNALDDFKRRVDQVRTWVNECTELNVDHPFIARTTLYRTYKDWAARDGNKAVKAAEFYDRLGSIRGVVPTRIHGGQRGFTGLIVTDHAESQWLR